MNGRVMFKFRLHVAGDATNCAQALAKPAALCRADLPDRDEIEAVDVFREPKHALADGIFITPTLVGFAPSTAQEIAGILSRTQPVL